MCLCFGSAVVASLRFPQDFAHSQLIETVYSPSPGSISPRHIEVPSSPANKYSASRMLVTCLPSTVCSRLPTRMLGSCGGDNEQRAQQSQFTEPQHIVCPNDFTPVTRRPSTEVASLNSMPHAIREFTTSLGEFSASYKLRDYMH